MLGLRRFRQTQIDIWQGDIEKFAVDLIGSEPEAPKLSGWLATLDRLDQAGVRHVSLPVTSPTYSQEALAATKSFLSSRSQESRTTPGFQRLTFVAGNGMIYEALQSALFSTFEDEPDAMAR